MIKVSILYPDREQYRFEWEYYVNTHMPMSMALLGQHAGYRGVSVERGITGRDPGSRPCFVAMCHFTFTSVDDFVQAFTPHAGVLERDLSNYTDIQPNIQFSEVAITC
jgi:uncharacterized protein (TIGR02118 family)